MKPDWDVLPIPEVVRACSRKFGEKVALVAREKGGDRRITYKELGKKVELLARGLAKLGFSANSKCAILGPNSPEWAMAYLAIQTAGGICVPLDSLLSPNEIRHLLADSKAEYAFVAPKFLDILLDTHRGFPSPRKIIVLACEDEEPIGDVISFNALINLGKEHKAKLPGRKLDDIASIIYTSGTTGQPKGVMLTHGNIISDVAACFAAIDIREERFLSVLPMHHTFECTAGFLLPLYSGCTVTYARSLKSKYIIEDLQASRATVMLGVPLLFQKMLESIHRAVERSPVIKRGAFTGLMKAVKLGEKLGKKELGKHLFKGLREKAGLGHLRLLVVGGAPLMPYIPGEFRRLGLKMIQGYGLTEASPVLTINPVEDPVDESIGKPLPSVEVKVLNPDDSGVGELAFKGPMIMKGYYQNEVATREVLTEDGWLKTGDLGFQDDKGYLYICGRGKNLIVTPAGKNVYPEELEGELNRSPFVLESMVYGHPLPTGGEEVRAVIVPDYETLGHQFGGKRLDEKQVYKIIKKEVKRANQKIASYKRIKSFTLQDEEFIKTSTKKIKRHLFKAP